MKFLDHLSMARKFWASTLFVTIALLGVAIVTQRHAANTVDEALADLQRQQDSIVEATRWKGMTQTNLQRLLAAMLISDDAIAAQFDVKLKEGIAETTALQKRITEAAVSDLDKQALETVAARRGEVLQMTKKAKEIRSGDDGSAAIRAYLDSDLLPAIARYAQAQDGVIEAQRVQQQAAKDELVAVRARAAWVALAAVAVVTVLALGFAALLVRSIDNALKRAVEVSQAIAEGDLTRELKADRRDELGKLQQAMESMRQRLCGVVSEVRSGVESVGTASSQIATGNLDLSQRTEEQAANLQHTAASMGRLTSTVKQNADNARAASQLAAGASEVATEGGAVVSRVVTTMEAITESSRKIADIISVIDGIAFQTNILALNAAVEAARAGDQGRGFAVVASEVRALAQRSATAAKEIKGLIESSVAKVNDGSGLVQEAGRTMADIVAQVKRVNDLVGEITSASIEQSSGIGEVGDAVSQLDLVTQQNAALVEQAAAAADSMKQQAEHLSQVVSVFRVPG